MLRPVAGSCVRGYKPPDLMTSGGFVRNYQLPKVSLERLLVPSVQFHGFNVAK